MMLELSQLAGALGIGLCAGLIGGLAGIGGSMIMLPGLGLTLGYEGPEQHRHHLFMASAMMVNVLVALPATRQHQRAGAVRRDVVRIVMPTMAVAIIAGTLLSNQVQGRVLAIILAGFITLYCATNLWKIIRHGWLKHPERPAREEHLSPGRLAATGTTAGLVGGLLGLGGGVVMVPMLQLLAGVPLRMAIGTSSAVMCLTGAIGAGVKLAGLDAHGQSISDAIQLAAVMGPAAMLGAVLGARLTHWLPLNAVRALVSVLLFIAALRMARMI